MTAKTNWTPRPKVTAAAIGGIVVAGLEWAYLHFTGTDMDPELAGILATAGAALAGYWWPEAKTAGH